MRGKKGETHQLHSCIKWETDNVTRGISRVEFLGHAASLKLCQPKSRL